MFFGKKDSNMQKCENCGNGSSKKYSFCPHCGNAFIDGKKEKRDFGLLGRNDKIDSAPENNLGGFGITDKLINSIMNSMMKNLDKQFKEQFKEDIDKGMDNTEIKTFPNGIKIKISGPFGNNGPSQKKTILNKPRQINSDQEKRMNSLPREKAKTNVKRLGDKIIYELATPGVNSPQDIFISKLESGYEVKAIGSKKIYVNSIPLNLPLKKYSIMKDKLAVEFLSSENQPQF